MEANKGAVQELRDAARLCQQGGKIDDVVEVRNMPEENGTAVSLQWMQNDLVRSPITLRTQPDYPTNTARLAHEHSQITLHLKVDWNPFLGKLM